MIIEVKWAEPKGQPEELLLDLDDIAYCNRVTYLTFGTPNITLQQGDLDYIHVKTKTGDDLLLANGKKLYDFIKREKCKLTVEGLDFIYSYGSEPKR